MKRYSHWNDNLYDRWRSRVVELMGPVFRPRGAADAPGIPLADAGVDGWADRHPGRFCIIDHTQGEKSPARANGDAPKESRLPPL